MADHAHSTPAPDPIAAIREALERHFAERGISVDLDAVLPPPPAEAPPTPEPESRKDRHLARAYLDLEEAVAELHGMALVTDMIIVETMTMRSKGRTCVLNEDRADALEFAVGKLTALSVALNRAYSAAWPEVA